MLSIKTKTETKKKVKKKEGNDCYISENWQKVLTPNKFLRSGSLKRNGMFETCNLFGVLSAAAGPPAGREGGGGGGCPPGTPVAGF